MFNHILVAVDGSNDASRAVATGAAIAQLSGAELLLLHVVATHGGARLPSHLKAFDAIEHACKTQENILRDAADEILEEAAATITATEVDIEKSVAYGNPAETIVEQAIAANADLIVMGSRGLSDLKGLFLGSVSHKVSQLAQCAVMLVK
jgi:nucleotide-binding universal stress UspA family protein